MRIVFSIGMKTLWEKEEKAGFRHFLQFQQCFPNEALSLSVSVRVVKIWDCLVKC